MSETPKQAARRLSKQWIAKGYKPLALHEYRDADGSAIYWRVRLEHSEGDAAPGGRKIIRPMKVNGGGYTFGEPDFPDGKPLYNLHLLAADPTARVWIVEGEKAADALTNLGAVATTSGGADSADRADWSPLRGRECCLWRDSDVAGTEYAGNVAAILLGLECRLLAVDVDQLELAPKGDAWDWLQAHENATLADLDALPMLTPSVPSLDATAADSDGWPEPLPLAAKIAPEPYPVDALPATIRAAVEEVQGFTKAPVPLVASSALSALSLAIQAHYDVQRADKLQGPVAMFLLTIADSGERKTTCDGFFTKAIRDWAEEQAEAMKPEMKRFEAEIDAWTAERDGLLSKIKDAGKNDKPTDKLRAKLVDLQDQKPEPPRVPRLLLGDETPENLAWSLTKHWPASGVVSAEAGIVFGAHGMNRDSIMRNLALLNILWDGGTLSIGRRTSESFTVRGARLTVALQVQEMTLRNFFERSGGLARGTGFLSRFLIAWPESTQGYRQFTEAPPAWPALASFNRRIVALLEQPAPIGDDGTLSPALLTFTPDAKAAWIASHDAIESELRTGGELFDVRDVASKTADNAARLAALFHAFGSGSSNSSSSSISEVDFEGARRIVAWHLNEARRFFGELALPINLANAARLDAWLLSWCQDKRTAFVPRRTVQQYGPGGLRDGAPLDAAVRELEDLGRARLAGDGRRKDIRVNPALLEGSAA